MEAGTGGTMQASASITTALSADKTSVLVASRPTGTTGVTVAAMRQDGSGVLYFHEGGAFAVAKPGTTHDPEGRLYPVDHPLLDMQAVGAKGPLGGWAGRKLTQAAAPPPPPPPPSGVNTCLPGVCMNGGESFATRAGKAKALGAKVLRIEGSLTALAVAALEAGAKAHPIITSNVPVAEFAALDSAHKAAIHSLGGRNESWPGGIGGQMSGRAYGEWFVARAKEAKGVVPITCQVNLTPRDTAWTVDLLRTPGLAEALQGNYLDHHPYGVSMMNRLVNPGNPLDQSHGWESRRWMSEAWLIQDKLGVAVPSFLSELGGSLSHGGSWAKVVAEDAAIFEFLTMVKHGTVPVAERPGGAAYVPKVVAMTQYSLLGNRTGYETFGISFYDSEGGHNEEGGGRWRKWRDGAAALLAA